jgi:NTE family protein
VDRQFTFVLGGGGSHGALQAGALQALYERGLHPDLVVGTSIGAINAAYLARYGFNQDGLDKLKTTWLEAAAMDLMPSNYLWLTLRTLFNRDGGESFHRMRDFFINHGIHPDLRFGEFKDFKVLMVSSDLNSGEVTMYGADPNDLVLEGALASTALPPWVRPIETNGRYLVDGGFISNLPIEPAISYGASEIIALDLGDVRQEETDAHGFGPFLSKVIQTTQARQAKLEMEIAQARRVPVKHISLTSKDQVPIWDFHHVEELMRCGYEITQREMQGWRPQSHSKWPAWLPHFR